MKAVLYGTVYIEEPGRTGFDCRPPEPREVLDPSWSSGYEFPERREWSMVDVIIMEIAPLYHEQTHNPVPLAFGTQGRRFISLERGKQWQARIVLSEFITVPGRYAIKCVLNQKESQRITHPIRQASSNTLIVEVVKAL